MLDSVSIDTTKLPAFRPHLKIPEKVDIKKILQEFSSKFPPHLRWLNFHKNGVLAAEVLMSAEFIQIAAPLIDVIVKEKNDSIPIEISPTMRKYKIETIFAGLREALKLPSHTNGRFKIELSLGDLLLYSGLSGQSKGKNVNFLDPYASGYSVRIIEKEVI